MPITKVTAVVGGTVRRTASNITKPVENVVCNSVQTAVQNERKINSKSLLSAAVSSVAGFLGGMFTKKTSKFLPQTDAAVLSKIDSMKSRLNIEIPVMETSIDACQNIGVQEFATRNALVMQSYSEDAVLSHKYSINMMITELLECVPSLEFGKMESLFPPVEGLKGKVTSIFNRAKKEKFDFPDLVDRLTYKFSDDGENIIMEKLVNGQQEPNFAIINPKGKHITYLVQPKLKTIGDKTYESSKAFVFNGDAIRIFSQVESDGVVVKKRYAEKNTDASMRVFERYFGDDNTAVNTIISEFNPKTGVLGYKTDSHSSSRFVNFDIVEGKFLGGRYLDMPDARTSILYEVTPSKFNEKFYNISRLTYRNGRIEAFDKFKSDGFNNIIGSFAKMD